MNRDKILSMEAGRELDALIAEKVLGYRWNRQHLAYQKSPVEWVFNLPGYSTNISAAWKVVMAFDSKGLVVSLDNEGEGWNCCIGDRYIEGQESPELAICRAALLAVMIKED